MVHRKQPLRSSTLGQFYSPLSQASHQPRGWTLWSLPPTYLTPVHLLSNRCSGLSSHKIAICIIHPTSHATYQNCKVAGASTLCFAGKGVDGNNSSVLDCHVCSFIQFHIVAIQHGLGWSV
ncbi:hypothetical protein VFPPC_18474 [Pochonia chlamydosporia 170]|uniref:Uncharacterized protein n=1 Tax=Pochonia chlamydosporia 170 TaxID=1380566 RepID=A0A219AQ10_METCM|nr:hypothetical protein VFPPC_18474 [Pochonia chlamydosporia 170]OWT42394.1 hypothetical protein VFPPC_18474 [Pochonia chlamydosporia 170]